VHASVVDVVSWLGHVEVGLAAYDAPRYDMFVVGGSRAAALRLRGGGHRVAHGVPRARAVEDAERDQRADCLGCISDGVLPDRATTSGGGATTPD